MCLHLKKYIYGNIIQKQNKIKNARTRSKYDI